MFRIQIEDDGTGPSYHNGCFCHITDRDNSWLEKQGFVGVVTVEFKQHASDCLNQTQATMNINKYWVKCVEQVGGLLYD